MQPFHPCGYETCIHSRKRENAPWKVYDSCPNPGRILIGKRYELPYKSMCLDCSAYISDSKTDRNH